MKYIFKKPVFCSLLFNIIIFLIIINRPTYQKIIQGEGMPIYGDNSDKRGNIVLRFKINLPRYLSIENNTICKVLSETNIIINNNENKFNKMPMK